MKDTHDNLEEAVSSMPLSDDERARLRTHLTAYMREHPARAPFSIRVLDALSSVSSVLQHPQMQLAAAALAAVFVLGGGTAYAANTALPGEPLYSIKVNVEEPIQGAFATTAEAQANWNAQLAGRRLAEAEELAVQNRLTPATASTVTAGLDQATNNFNTSVAALATSTNNAAVVAGVESNMEVTLAANTAVLGELADAVPAAATSIAPIISHAQSGANALNSARVRLDAAAATTDTVAVKATTAAQFDAVQSEVNAISTDTVAKPQAQAAEASIEAGQQNLAQGDYTAALETLQAATLDAQEAQLTVSVAGALRDDSQTASGSAAPASTTATLSIPAIAATSTATTSATTTPAAHTHDR